MSHLKPVMMQLTEKDFLNTEKLTEHFRTHNKAEAVSIALSIAAFLSEMLQGKKELIVRDKNGNAQKVIIPRLTEEE